MPMSNSPGRSRIGFHASHTLDTIAGKYPRLQDAIWELFQNGLDPIPELKDRPKKDRLGKPYKPFIHVRIDEQKRDIRVRDNGCGASIARMDECLNNLSASLKSKEKLGRFGLGFMAPHGKCEAFFFSSIPLDGSNGPQRWTFRRSDLTGKAKGITVPHEPFTPGDTEWWNSELWIQNYDDDKFRSVIDFDRICDHITDAYNQHMKRKGVLVKVTVINISGDKQEKMVKPVDYTGTKLDPATYTGELCGKTTVQMWLAKPSGKRGSSKPKGKVTVLSSNGYGQPLKEKVFRPNGEPCILKKDALAVLESGLFEGEIIFDEPVEWEPSRRWFAGNAALLEAATHVEQWCESIGAKYIQKKEDEKTSTRYGKYLENLNKVLAAFIKRRPEFKKLFKNFQFGHIGSQHAKVTNPKDGKIDAKAVGGSGPKPRGNGNGGRARNKTPKERKGHTPIAAGGVPGSSPRTFVQGNSPGLIPVHGPLTNKNLWSLDESTGVLTINIMHPVWEQCDSLEGRTEKQRELLVCGLQERCVMQALYWLQTKATLTELYGPGHPMINDILAWVEDHISEYSKGELFLIAEADKLLKRGVYVDRVGEDRRELYARKKTRKITKKAPENGGA